MSSIARSGSVSSTLPRAASGGTAWLRRWHFFFAVLRAHPSFAVGYVIVVTVVVIAILAPWLAPYGPMTADPNVYLLPPGGGHLLGTDGTGMDIFSRVLFAPRIDLAIAVIGTFVSATIGGAVGALVGYYEGQQTWRRALSTIIMRSADVLQAFPVFVFAIALVAVFGQSPQSIILAIAFVNTPIYLRLMRIQVRSVSQMRYVEAAYVAGASDLAILRRHVIPNSIAPLMAQLSVNIGWSVLLTAGLSFVGAGVVAPTPEWGSMIAMGFQNVVTGQWWPSVFPGIALCITVVGFALVGASVEVLADPARRRVLSGSLR
jgi:peptide/nickel transport system permease protein